MSARLGAWAVGCVVSCPLAVQAAVVQKSARPAPRQRPASADAPPAADNSAALAARGGALAGGKLEEAEAIARGRPVAARREARGVLGVVLDQRGQAEEAEREYREAIRLDPSATRARQPRRPARAHRAARRGRRSFEAALRLSPATRRPSSTSARSTPRAATTSAPSRSSNARPACTRASHPADVRATLRCYSCSRSSYLGTRPRGGGVEAARERIERGAGEDPRVLFTLGLASPRRASTSARRDSSSARTRSGPTPTRCSTTSASRTTTWTGSTRRRASSKPPARSDPARPNRSTVSGSSRPRASGARRRSALQRALEVRPQYPEATS